MERRETSGFKNAVEVYKRDFLAFDGYATRAEYWWGMGYLLLINLATMAVYTIVAVFLGSIAAELVILPAIVVFIMSVVMLFSSIAATFRRYRDVGFTAFSTILIYIVLFWLLITTSEYHYTSVYGSLQINWTNHNIFFIIVFIFALILYVLPSELFAITGNNKLLGLFFAKKFGE